MRPLTRAVARRRLYSTTTNPKPLGANERTARRPTAFGGIDLTPNQPKVQAKAKQNSRGAQGQRASSKRWTPNLGNLSRDPFALAEGGLAARLNKRRTEAWRAGATPGSVSLETKVSPTSPKGAKAAKGDVRVNTSTKPQLSATRPKAPRKAGIAENSAWDLAAMPNDWTRGTSSAKKSNHQGKKASLRAKRDASPSHKKSSFDSLPGDLPAVPKSASSAALAAGVLEKKLHPVIEPTNFKALFSQPSTLNMMLKSSASNTSRPILSLSEVRSVVGGGYSPRFPSSLRALAGRDLKVKGPEGVVDRARFTLALNRDVSKHGIQRFVGVTRRFVPPPLMAA